MDVETTGVALFTDVMPSTTTRGTARHDLTGLRRMIAKRLTRAASLVRPQPKVQSAVLSLDPTRFVRACPQFVHIEEYLDFEEEISRNPSVDLSGDPAGRIRIVVPFDGGAHFGTDARDDAALCLGDDDSADEAVIGYLVFVEHEKTDLADVLGLASRFGSHPMRLPIRSTNLPDINALTADRVEFRREIPYSLSEGPKVVPLTVDVRLYDPGHGDDQFLEKSDVPFVSGNADVRRFIAELIKESAEFRPYLTLRITPQLVLPPRQRPRGSTELPVVRSVRVLLPPEVSVPVSAIWTEGVHGLQVDPLTGALEWRGEPMEPPQDAEQKDKRAKKKDGGAEQKGDGPRRFRSKPMELNFTRPGELFMQKDLSVEVCVEVPDELLSGTRVRMFTATGEPEATGSRRVLQTRTVITTHCRVILHDAFLKRQISPSHTVSFDEIVPDAQRVSDVRAALVDQRFEVD
jgi:hypothetical protein